VLSGTRDCPGRKRGDSTFRKVKLCQSVFRQEALGGFQGTFRPGPQLKTWREIVTALVYFLTVPQLGQKDSAAVGGIELESSGLSKGDAALKFEG